MYHVQGKNDAPEKANLILSPDAVDKRILERCARLNLFRRREPKQNDLPGTR
jgi:hypothetical protein